MKNLENVLTDYLKTKTNYAFLINGKWGSGKTYYYKNHLTKLIEQTNTLENDSKKYRSVHVSLFGLTSIEEIQTQIFLSLNTFLKNKTVKLTAGLGKSLARGIFALKNLGNIDDYISDVKPDGGDWINISELVICLDDLERKSANLPLEELIGFINSLVENNDAKIIIIANEDKIDDKSYDQLKEKVVGVSIEFIFNFEEKIKSIISDRYKESYKSYYKFLEDNKEILIDYSQAFNENLRILIFALEKFHTVYSEIKNNALDIPSEKKDIFKDKLLNIFKYTIAISIEYKNNKISYNERKGIEKAGGYADFTNLALSMVDKEPKNEKPYREIFIDKYFKSRDEYRFYETLYIYVTGADKFIFENLSEEINKIFHVSNNQISPPYQVINDLNFQNVIHLEEMEYRVKTRKLVEYAQKGYYSLQEYLTVFYYATRFKNPLRYSPEKLKGKLLSGIKKVNNKNKYIHALDFYLDVNENSDYVDILLELKEASIEKNKEINDENLKLEAQNLLILFEKNWIDFQYKVKDEDDKWKYTPFLQHASAYKFYVELNNSDFLKLLEFLQFVKYRYRSFSNELKPEQAFIKELKDKLEPTSKKRQKANLKNYFLDEILKELSKILKSWN